MPRKPKAEKQREHTERVALELYHNRLLLGKPGDEHSDWAKADKIVRSPIRTTLFASNRPLIKLEKHLFEPISRHLQQSAVFDIVDRLSPALEATGVLLIPLVLYLATQNYQQQQADQEIERLQQETVQNYIGQLSEIFLNVNGDLRANENQRIRTIATAATITLFRDPNLDSTRKGQVIEFLGQMGVVQGSETAETPIISLSGAQLFGAKLNGADLSGADLSAADLIYADLSAANLIYANLGGANLGGAELSFANLSGAKLSGANLFGANLIGADIIGADISDTNLINANFSDTNLSGANLIYANLSNAENLTQDQLSLAKLCRTTLPDDMTLDPNRDCKELGIDPKTGELLPP